MFLYLNINALLLIYRLPSFLLLPFGCFFQTQKSSFGPILVAFVYIWLIILHETLLLQEAKLNENIDFNVAYLVT